LISVKKGENLMDKKVMIVDDEPDVLFSLKTVLERYDYDVLAVSSGEDCLLEIENGYKGIILIDLMMPGLAGWDTINEIVNRGYIKDVAISIIKGKGAKDYQKMNLLGSFIFDYLVKPIDINNLIDSVEKCARFFYSRYN
jgi:DNA-binding response OmpR family regulator